MPGSNHLRLLAAASLVLSSGSCGSKSPSHRSFASATNDDECRVLKAQAAKPGIEAKAQHGDVVAQQEMWDYYSACGELRQAEYWEQRLIQSGDGDAMRARASALMAQAQSLANGDPQKRDLLKQALNLDARGRQARDGKLLHVTVNGKDTPIRLSGEPDDLTKNIQAELARVQGGTQG